MISAFKDRQPWAAALINLLFGPFIGMLYLNRARLALVYVGLGYVGVAALFILLKPATLFGHGLMVFGLSELSLRAVGTIHGVSIARRRQQDEPIRWYARWYTIAAIFLILVAAPYAIRGFLFRPFNLPSGSMSPTLNKGDYFWVWKPAYKNTSPQRGDVVVFKWGIIFYVKRIVGVPGDRIQMVKGKLYINGVAVSLKRIEDFNGLCEQNACPARQYVETLPGGQTHRILDFMDNSPEDDTQIYIVPANNYFVMGDNRDNSSDSRTGIGFVPAEDIVGRGTYKFVDALTQRFTWMPIE